MKCYILESTDRTTILNSFIDKWVTTTANDRASLPFSYVKMIAKSFPESVYSGEAYRTVYIIPSYIDYLLKSLYVTSVPTESDRQFVETQLIASDSYQQQSAEELIQYWDDVTGIRKLIPNGNRLWWKGIRVYINKYMSGRYTSWSEDLTGTTEFQQIVDRANRMVPIQFRDSPRSWPFTIKATVNGISLVAVSDYIQNQSRKSEILRTKEVIAIPNSEYEIVEQSNPDHQLLPVEYIMNHNE